MSHNSLQQQIETGDTLLIAPLRCIPEWKITRAKQKEWRRFVEAIEAVDALRVSSIAPTALAQINGRTLQPRLRGDTRSGSTL